jgi:hypothetical protein
MSEPTTMDPMPRRIIDILYCVTDDGRAQSRGLPQSAIFPKARAAFFRSF